MTVTNAASDGGRLVVVSDLSATNFCVGDDGNPPSVYVIHTGAAEASRIRFSITPLHSWQGGSMTMSVANVDTYGNLPLGSIETGMDVVYVGCKPLPHLVCRIDYTGTGTSAPCSIIAPAPHTEDSHIEATDCDGTVWAADCNGIYVNGGTGDACLCHYGAPCVPSTVSSEATTWGAIKSLYR